MNEHQEFFDRPEKKVAFLTGCYVSTVLSVQRQHLQNDPFFGKVRGLKMGQKRLQDIYPEARNKLHQYDRLGLVATTLDPQLAQAWIDCGGKWNLSDDEATFAFTLGLSLAWKVRGAGETNNDADTVESASAQ
jgi:CRISPR-associated protein Csh1